MSDKKVLVMSTLLMAIVLLGIGTIAYFRRTVSGNVTGQAGYLGLIVNGANSIDSETFTLKLQRSESENFVMPDDKGKFDLNIDVSGSSVDTAVTISIARTNLPDNLKFYIDEEYTTELITKSYKIEKSNDMTLSIPIYWYWNGKVSDENDSLFINKEISAEINVNATMAKTLYETLLSKNFTLDTNVDFTLGASSTNGEGLMMMTGTENNTYPILYYRGDVVDNNVIFGDFCWLIVRTTETGGLKLIYNGLVNEDGSCINYSGVGGEDANTAYDNAYTQRSAFNTNYDSPVYAGYMYNDANKFFTHSEGWDGSTVEDAKSTLDTESFITLLADNTIDGATGRHVQNLKDSVIKGVIDTWYGNNIAGTSSETLIEDTVWCADRSITGDTYSLENYTTNKAFRYSARTRITGENGPTDPMLECARDVDKFTVSDTVGNGDLTYPVGMLTMDEIWMAGNILYVADGDVVITYLTIPTSSYWSLSPSGFGRGAVYTFDVLRSRLYNNGRVSLSRGVRPSLSIGLDTLVTSGNGSFSNPYRVS